MDKTNVPPKIYNPANAVLLTTTNNHGLYNYKLHMRDKNNEPY